MTNTIEQQARELLNLADEMDCEEIYDPRIVGQWAESIRAITRALTRSAPSDEGGQGEDDAWCAECGVKLENVRPGKHQHPTCSQAAPHQPEARVGGGWFLSASSINDIQCESVDKQIAICKQAHYTDLDVRINGQNQVHEADWIKHMVKVTTPPPSAVPEIVGWLHEVVWEDGTAYSFYRNQPGLLGPRPGLVSERIGRAAFIAAAPEPREVE